MLNRKRLTVLVIIAALILCFAHESAAQMNKKTYTLVHGSFAMVSKMGNNSDYVPGENDFPVTPAHIELGGGGGVFINMSNMFALQFTADYLMGAEVDKEDPTDGETFKYKTYNNINVLGSVIVKFGGQIQFFLSGGGGVSVLMPYADKEVQGSLGSIIMLTPPDKKVHPMAALGGGVMYHKKKFFIKAETLYTMVFDYGKNALLFRLGIGF